MKQKGNKVNCNIYSKEDMMNIAGWMAAADNKRPIPELKEEAEEYIKRLDAEKSGKQKPNITDIYKELLKACQWIDSAIKTGNVRGLFDEEKEQLAKAIEMAESVATETADKQLSYTETDMLLALEFGYKQCEKGNNLEMAFINYRKLNDKK